MKSKSVLLVSSEFPPGPGGIGNHAYHLAKFLDREGIKVTVITNRENCLPKEADAFKNQHFFRIIYIKRYRFLVITYFLRIFWTARFLLGNPDMICICTGKFSLWTGALFKAVGLKNYCMGILHGSEVNFREGRAKTITEMSLQKMNHLIAVSNYTKSLISEEFQAKTTVVPNGIACADLGNGFLTQKEIPGDPKVLTVGNVTKRKGQQNLIKALPVLCKRFPSIHYHIVGLPTNRDAFLNIALELGVQDHVTFHNKVSFAELKFFYTECDVFCMLSELQADGDTEGFGIAILEGNYFGLPSIGSKNCGIEDAIANGRTGFLVDPGNPEEISDSLRQILVDYHLFSKNAQGWAKEHDWAKIIERYKQVLP